MNIKEKSEDTQTEFREGDHTVTFGSSFWGTIESLRNDFSEFASSLQDENKDTFENMKTRIASVIESHHEESTEFPKEQDVADDKSDLEFQVSETIQKGSDDASKEKITSNIETSQRFLMENVQELSHSVTSAFEQIGKGISAFSAAGKEELARLASSNVLVDELKETKPVVTVPAGTFVSQLQRLQSSQETFLTDPISKDGAFTSFKLSFNIKADAWMEKVNSVLESSVSVLEMHKTLCGINVDEQSFWCRYFFRLQVLEEQEHRRKEIARKLLSNEEEDDGWGDDAEEDDLVKIEHEDIPDEVLEEWQ